MKSSMTHCERRFRMACGRIALWLVVCCGIVAPAQASSGTPTEISSGQQDARGIRVHTVRCEYQAGVTEIRVLMPDRIDAERRYRVLYVLPVEAGNGVRWGDALGELLKHDLHNKHQLICVMPSFSHLPWYADHPTDAEIRQESYFVRVVVPTVEKHYPALARRDGRLLVGFSKSGWGAWSLLLRHPELFQRAAAWDAPLMMDWPSRYGSRDIFGTRENFQKYQLTELAGRHAAVEAERARLVHFGYGGFRDDHQRMHARLNELKIAHTYRDGPQKTHSWHGGWLPEAVQMLVEPVNSVDEQQGDRQQSIYP